MIIKEYIHLGKLNPKNRYADIEVDIQFNIEQKEYFKLKAFIDTGAGRSSVNEKLIQHEINLQSGKYQEKYNISSGGQFKSYIIPEVQIRLNPLLDEQTFVPIDFVETFNSEKIPYDIIIGNDILFNCEFIYNGLSETYVLKMFFVSSS